MTTQVKPFPQTEIEYLKGVGSVRGELLKKELDIFTVGDLLQHYPFRYIDRTRIYKIAELTGREPYIQIKGKLLGFQEFGEGRNKRLSAILADDTGKVELIWFQGLHWVKKMLKKDSEYLVFGKPALFRSRINIPHPEMELLEDINEKLYLTGFQPVYSTTEKLKSRGLHSKGLQKLIANALERIVPADYPENLPPSLREKYGFISHFEAVKNIHQPADNDMLQRAVYRLKFEELFFLQMRILSIKTHRREKASGFIFSNISNRFQRFYDSLPFQLTGAQKRVLREIRRDVLSGKQMNRLLQGDVGSGKTIVALMTMLMAIDNDYQACLMAPTEILAQQHYKNFLKLTSGLNVHIALLTGSVKGAKRKRLLSLLKSGDIHILVGTHALIEDQVTYKNLGCVVIDEQHRFGVAQRARLWEKSEHPPHVLVMTATPIPRTLAMTVYGDLDVSVIDELPPGRQEITTVHRSGSARDKIYEFIRSQIHQGRQAYIVYPLIEESESLDLRHLYEGYEQLSKVFPPPRYQIGVVHGRMKPEEKEKEMQRFAAGKTHILVSTTVIEVGVDVPNATVMVIENAERFGLAQLHQLRGRVGRGSGKSYCILLSGDKLTSDARKRLQTMVQTNDGFKIAEVDMHLRGPGEIEGTRQSGLLSFKLVNLIEDEKILKEARKSVIEILERDPRLALPEHRCIRNYLQATSGKRFYWSRIA